MHLSAIERILIIVRMAFEDHPLTVRTVRWPGSTPCTRVAHS